MARGSSSNIQRAKLRRVQSLDAEHAYRAAGAELVAEHLAEQRRHLVIRQKVVAHGRSIPRRDLAGLERATGEDRLGGEPGGEHGLADALAGHRVGGHRGIADEAHTAAGQRCPVDAGRNGPGGVAILQLEAVAERLDDVRPLQQVAPLLLHVAGRGVARRVARRSRRWPARRAAGSSTCSPAAGRARTTRSAARPRAR